MDLNFKKIIAWLKRNKIDYTVKDNRIVLFHDANGCVEFVFNSGRNTYKAPRGCLMASSAADGSDFYVKIGDWGKWINEFLDWAKDRDYYEYNHYHCAQWGTWKFGNFISMSFFGVFIKKILALKNGVNESMQLAEAKKILKNAGYICEAKAKDDSLYAKAKDRIKKDYQKYVPQLKEINSKIDAKSFQDYLSKVLKRKINFHTSPKGELFWDITSQEQNKLPVRIPLLAYRVDYHLFGRKDDKWRIVINNKYNQQVFDTSCWNNNIRAYRAEVSAEADPMMIELANKIMRAYNKVPKYVQAGKIFKSRIMQVEPDGEWHSIGSTLDIDAIEEMGYNLKEEMYNDVTVEKGKGVFPSVNITFEYNYSIVEIQAMVAPMYVNVNMKVTKK